MTLAGQTLTLQDRLHQAMLLLIESQHIDASHAVRESMEEVRRLKHENAGLLRAVQRAEQYLAERRTM